MLMSIFTSTLIGSWWLSSLFGLFGGHHDDSGDLGILNQQCDFVSEGEGYDQGTGIWLDIAESVDNLEEQGITCFEFCNFCDRYAYIYQNENLCQCSNELPPPYIRYRKNSNAHSGCESPNYKIISLEDPSIQGCTSGTFLHDRIPLLSSLSHSKSRSRSRMRSSSGLQQGSKRRDQNLELMDLLSLA